MSFVLRVVLILIIFSFVVYVFKAIARLRFHLRGTIKDVQKIRDQINTRATSGAGPSAEMVRCAGCGAFVSARDAVTVSSRNRSQVYCSQECLQVKVGR